MPGRIRRMTATEVEQILRRHGFALVAQHGSHRKWRNSVSRFQVIVPDHTGKQLPLGTLRNIFGNSGIPESEWRE
jgi:predicted RNA binding protein YcfA (HicA-like mRNA interferase family)